MKCVNCGTDNNLEDRTANDGRCKNCNHPFAFDPKAGSAFTDVFFKRSLEAISNENSLFFTRKQFLYFLERRREPKEYSNIIALCVLEILSFVSVATLALSFQTLVKNFFLSAMCVIVTAILLFLIHMRGSSSQSNSYKKKKNHAILMQVLGYSCIGLSIIASLTLAVSNEMKFLVFLIGVGFGLFSIYFGIERVNQSYYIPQKFNYATPRAVNTWLNRWTEFNSVEKLLPSPRVEIGNIEVSPEISAYSFDRLLVCDTCEIAQFLIANNFHFEHNCAVLSIDRYPQSVFSTVMEMLRRNRELIVYAFHSATPRGVALAHKLQTSDRWFANSDVYIRDLGLLPRHIFSSRNMFILNSPQSVAAAGEIPTEVRENLSVNEIEWLEAGNYVELESFSPRRLLLVVSRGISRGGGGGIIAIDHDDSYSLSYDVDDSFG
ncbi:MAG: hypothetical protein SXA11_05685 [Cyanobacteriota bacterium]|nr:hypothetical protein [Cyanobacteriota bacterium]